MSDKKITAMGVGDSPNTILSYGIMMDYVVRSTSKKYQWNVITNGYTYGKPEIYTHWVKWSAGQNEKERDSIHIPKVIEKIHPAFILTIGDWQHFAMTRHFIRKIVPWIHWLPIDHNDAHHLLRAAGLINTIDIPVLMSRFAVEFCRSMNINVKHYIYPFVQTDSLPKYMGNDKFGGFKPLEDPKQIASLGRMRTEIGADDKKVLLWVGRPGWRKNLQMLLGAFRLLLDRGRKDIILYLHTDPKDVCATFDMGKEIHAQRIPRNLIKFTTEMEWDQGAPKWFLQGLYNMADVYVSTHCGEGFGIPIAEAMACETPFVLTNCTTTPELGQDEKGNWTRGLGAKVEDNREDRGVVRPYVDIEDFCDKVEWMLDNDEERKKMGKAGREWVIKNCSVPVITKKWMNLLDLTTVNKVELGGIIDDK